MMFSAAIKDGDDCEDGDELHGHGVNTDSITSFAEWFFSIDEHFEKNNHRRSGSRRSGFVGGNGAATPMEMRNWHSANETGGNDNEVFTKRRTKNRPETPQPQYYNEFIQCAESSIDIVSYVLDPLGDICRGNKMTFNSTWDEREYHPVAHPNKTKLNRCPENSYFTKQQQLEHSKMNYCSKVPSLESINEFNTTSSTTSSKSYFIDIPTASFSPRGVEMTSDPPLEKSMDMSDEFDDGRLGIAPLTQFSNLDKEENSGIVRQLFVLDENEFVGFFSTNAYRQNCNEQHHSTTLSQMLIETVHLRSHFQCVDAPNYEIRPSSSPDPHAIYCCQPRQRIRLEDTKFRKMPLSSDPHAIYCCPPQVRIRHEKTCDEIKGNNKNNSETYRDDKEQLKQSTTKSSDGSINVATVPASSITASTSITYTMKSGWSGDRLNRAKMKRRAKMKDRLISIS